MFSHLPDTPGPCPPGHIFRIPDDVQETTGSTLQLLPRAQCQCKEGYVPWSDGICYRLYTRGPCGSNEFLVNGTSCVRNFCGKNRLYFPAEDSCYRIGSQGSSILTCLLLLLTTGQNPQQVAAGIVPPPWSDPAKNPCASMSGGWQLLYWAPLKKCFKIFSLGYPCPETMELSPTAVSAKRRDLPAAECRCPPGAALSPLTNNVCYKLYERGPCQPEEYFQPMPDQVKR